MPSEPRILAFDTSAAHCAAALLCGDRIVASKVELLARGQAERLMPLLDEVLTEGGVAWSDLTRIGVGVGPGNFTGIRISVAAARGLALSLGIPAIGISSLQLQFDGTPIVATVPAPRDQVYAQIFGFHPQDPELMLNSEAKKLSADKKISLSILPPPEGMVSRIAQLAATSTDLSAPAPQYVRAADAAPPRDPAPVILP